MPQGICHLCGANCDLQLSHVLPAFVFNWLKKTSGTGYIRLGKAPNQRKQDGWKRHWLCSSCESLFSRWETTFATQLFHPFLKEHSNHFSYDLWLLQFCVSVSWRVLHYHREIDSFDDYTADVLARMDDAEVAWKEFLLGRRPNLEAFQQHLLPLYPIDATTGELSPNINRYLLRSIDMDIVLGDITHIVYAKLGRFLIVGFIREDHPNRWRGTKVEQNGLIEPRNYEVPRRFLEYVNDQARRQAELMAMISDCQREKVDKVIRADPSQFARSDSLRAIEHDIRLFGLAAFTHPNEFRKDML